MTRLTDEDRAEVSKAVAAAEAGTNGEIVAVVTAISDPYHDVGLHWAMVPLFAVLAGAAWRPDLLTGATGMLIGGWDAEPTLGQLLTVLMVLAALVFTVALMIMKYMPLRIALTPGATKQRRVRRRALAIFRSAAERRTAERTGVLIYLSMGERRAEIIGDDAITAVTTPETWGDAMTALLLDVREGRIGEGIAAAIADVGKVLAEHFPRTDADVNEIPDKLIEL